MKHIPILFSTPMVQAILDGRKIMTRRIVKPQPDPEGDGIDYMPLAPSLYWEEYYNEEWKPFHWETSEGESIASFCPYGQPGDVLYVRETHFRYGKWVKNGTTKTGKQKWKFKPAKGFDNFRYQDKPKNFN